MDYPYLSLSKSNRRESLSKKHWERPSKDYSNPYAYESREKPTRDRPSSLLKEAAPISAYEREIEKENKEIQY